jgi:pimeloyl-ACP methyl ester carboxylesterase
MRRLLTLASMALALVPATAAAADPAYAPVDRPGPPLDVPSDKIAAAMECSKGVDRAARTPVLLVPGTGASAHDNYSWNYEPEFDKQGIPWCAITFPYDGNGDIQVNGEYMVYAIRTMYERAGRKIAIVGHSQGGMVPRWALRFWPDTRAMVDDMIGFAPSNHGTTQAGLVCHGNCLIANWQQSFGSNFIRALNSYQETFPGISYTNVYTHNDEVVRPNSDDTGSSSLHGGGGRITNVAVQDVCPNDSSDHDLLGTVDAVAYALAMDAYTHDGPADKSRIPASTCAQPYMPGIDPATGPAAGIKAFYDDESSTGPETPSEPPLACYVYASCVFASAGQPGSKGASCTGTGALRFRLHHWRHERIVAADVYVDGKRVRRRRGHSISSVAIGPVSAAHRRIRIITRSSRGVRRSSVRAVLGCKLGKPHTRRLR